MADETTKTPKRGRKPGAYIRKSVFQAIMDAPIPVEVTGLPITAEEARALRIAQAKELGETRDLVVDLWSALQAHAANHFHGTPEFQALRDRVYGEV